MLGTRLLLLQLGALVAIVQPLTVLRDPKDSRQYDYKSYNETFAFFDDVKRRCPDIVETFVAQEVFPEILPSGKSDWAACDGQPCKTLIVRVGNKQKMTDTTPEVFFSGALHGDERIGPITVTELADFLCVQYQAGNEEIRRLVDTRNTWIMPMTNAAGYAGNTRLENGMDPNRDFPYLQSPENCMRTQTARAVNELFRRHLFQFAITFHGGMRALTYEWGSPNHNKGAQSTESPDDSAFTQVGEQIQSAAGWSSSSKPFYPLGRINDMVYPVFGGMEDWSYAAGWETASEAPITGCKPSTYGGYSESRTRYAPGSVGTLVYLAEADDFKTPPSGTLGRAGQVFGNDVDHGHVPRNMRMCLKIMELARPEVIVQPPAWGPAVPKGAELKLGVRAQGCVELSAARLLLVPRALVKDCVSLASPSPGERWSDAARSSMLEQSVELGSLPQPSRCAGLSIWARSSGTAEVLSGKVPDSASGEYCVAIAAEFDLGWAKQKDPDPPTSPRAFSSRLRLEDHYEAAASDGPMRLDEYRIKLFPVRAEPLHVGE